MIKTDNDGYRTIYDKDGGIVAYMSPADMVMLHNVFNHRYQWTGMLSRASMEDAFIHAWGFYKQAFRRRLVMLERKNGRLKICDTCGRPRFRDEDCESGGPGCDL